MPIIKVDDLIEFSDLFTVVEEPEHSKKKLLSYQQKYGICSDEFYNYYNQILGLDSFIGNEDFDDWVYNYEIFLEADGDIWELKREMISNSEEVNNFNPWDSECHLKRQASYEEKQPCFSSFIKYLEN
jgi:hypothetical protein